MEPKYISGEALSDFVHYHDLQDRNSNCFFKALVTITTSQNKITNEEMKVMITLDGYNSTGEVSLLDHNLDPYLYPTVFKAKYSPIEHINKEYLKIMDTHKQNPKIGKYTVKIIPLRRLKD